MGAAASLQNIHPKIDDFCGLAYGVWYKCWKDVSGYEGRYEVNHVAEVRNKKTGNIVKPTKKHQVQLCGGQGNLVMKLVYHLAIEAFFPHIPRNGRTCDHIDENHHNHHINNLQWLTLSQQNIKTHQLQPRNNGPTRSKPVEQWTLETPSAKVATFSSACEAERQTKIGHGGISNCARGRSSSAGGFRWQFQELESQKDLEGEIWDTNDMLVAALQKRRVKKKLENLKKVRVSNFGRIKDVLGRISKGTKDHDSCYREYEGWQVHQLVWIVWGDGRPVPKKGDTLEICHNDELEKDEDGCVDNGIKNLKLDTHSKNMQSYHQAKAKKRVFAEISNANS